MASQLISSDTMKTVKGTWAKVGTMMIVSHELDEAFWPLFECKEIIASPLYRSEAVGDLQ